MPGPIATLGSMHVCPMTTGPTPHVGGPVTGPGTPNILVNGKPAAIMGDMCVCVGPPDVIVQGAPNVFFNGVPVACVGDMTAHGGVITVGEPNVIVGSATPAPSVTMAASRIPFPKITMKDRLLASLTGNSDKLKEAEENQKKLKDEEGESEQGEPYVYNVQWIKEDTVISEEEVLKEVTVRANVFNIPDGESVSFKILRPTKTTDENGNIIETEEEVIELTGTVQDKMVEVVWKEIEDVEDQENSES